MNPNYQQQLYDGFNNPQPTDRSEGTPFPVGKLLFGVFLMVGLMLVAFYIGVIEPIVKKLNKKPEQPPTQPTILELWKADETTTKGENLIPRENDVNELWRKKNEELGLIENSRLNGNHVGEDLLKGKENPNNDTPAGQGENE